MKNRYLDIDGRSINVKNIVLASFLHKQTIGGIKGYVELADGSFITHPFNLKQFDRECYQIQNPQGARGPKPKEKPSGFIQAEDKLVNIYHIEKHSFENDKGQIVLANGLTLTHSYNQKTFNNLLKKAKVL